MGARDGGGSVGSCEGRPSVARGPDRRGSYEDWGHSIPARGRARRASQPPSAGEVACVDGVGYGKGESIYGHDGRRGIRGEWDVAGRNVLLGSSPLAVTSTRRMAPTAPVTAAISPPTAPRDTHLPCTVRPDDPTDRTRLLPCFPVCPFSPPPCYKPSDARSSRPFFHSRHGRLR